MEEILLKVLVKFSVFSMAMVLQLKTVWLVQMCPIIATVKDIDIEGAFELAKESLESGKGKVFKTLVNLSAA